jgi:hypothetical protein
LLCLDLKLFGRVDLPSFDFCRFEALQGAAKINGDALIDIRPAGNRLVPAMCGREADGEKRF